MVATPHITVRVDLPRIRANAGRIAQSTGVDVIAVVKADAYGLGAAPVAAAIADLVAGFYVFDAAESLAASLFETGRRTFALLGASNDPQDYLSRRIQPAVWSVERAAVLRQARPILCIDTGQQRFSCTAANVAAVKAAGQIDEAFTHATSAAQAALFRQIVADAGGFAYCHAAGSALLDDPTARFNAVRPGLALYRDAVRVSTALLDVHESSGPAGYTGFVVSRHGVIRAGYANGLRPGLCWLNGRRSRILEVGMQSAFVECAPGDHAGDEVVLLGDTLGVDAVAAQWKTTPQECLLRLAQSGVKQYLPA
jgi:alanine racemase